MCSFWIEKIVTKKSNFKTHVWSEVTLSRNFQGMDKYTF